MSVEYPLDPALPCSYPPGDAMKLACLIERRSRRLPLFHFLSILVSMPLFCPRCQARLDVSPDPSDGRVTCPSWRAIFSLAEKPNDTPRLAPPDETGVTRERGIQVRPIVSSESHAADQTGSHIGNDLQKARDVPWYLLGIALLPLVIPAVAIPLHLLVGGLAGGALWGAVGGGLAGVCLAIARRRTWPSLARVVMALGLAGLSFAILLGALAPATPAAGC